MRGHIQNNKSIFSYGKSFSSKGYCTRGIFHSVQVMWHYCQFTQVLSPYGGSGMVTHRCAQTMLRFMDLFYLVGSLENNDEKRWSGSKTQQDGMFCVPQDNWHVEKLFWGCFNLKCTCSQGKGENTVFFPGTAPPFFHKNALGAPGVDVFICLH